MPDETTPEDDGVREDSDAKGDSHAVPGNRDAAIADDLAAHPEGSGRSPVVIAVSAMLLAIATLGASAYMWRNPVTPVGAPAASVEAAEPTFTDAERQEAKARVCDAFLLVSTGVANSSALQAQSGNTTSAVAVATSARLALLGGGQYMLLRIDPAAAPELAEPARAFGNALMDVGAAALAQIPSDNPAHQERIKDADEENVKLAGICNPQ